MRDGPIIRHPGSKAAKLLLSAALWTAAAPASAETLSEALAMAYQNNPTLGAARYDARAQDETLVQARSELRPTASLELSGGYDYSRLGQSSRLANPFAPPNSGTTQNGTDLVVDQPIYTGGRAAADQRLALAGIKATREALRAAEGDLMLAVVSDYMDVRRYAAALEVWRTSVSVLEKIVTEIRARRTAGELTLTDVAQGEAQLQMAREQMVATEQALEQARADYAALVGRFPGTLAEAPTLPQIPATVDTAYYLAEQQNPDLAQSRYTEEASAQSIAVARSNGRPTLKLRGEARLTGDTYPYRVYDQDKQFTGSVVLSVPLTNGGLIASQVREARERNGSDRMKVEAASRQVLRDVANAWNAIISANRQLDLLTLQQQAAITQLDGMIKEYRAGLRSTFDVLYAQQQLRDVQVSLLGSSRDSYVAQATLLRRTGLLEARSILANVPLYDAQDHLHHIRNANWVPWESVVARIDSVAAAPPSPRPLVRPPTPAAPVTVQPSGPGPTAATPLARTAPPHLPLDIGPGLTIW